MAAVTPSIASPGPAPVAPYPGPPQAALRLPRLLLNRSRQLFSGCNLGPADPAPRPAHLGTAHYTLRIRPPPAPARGRMDRWMEDAGAPERLPERRPRDGDPEGRRRDSGASNPLLPLLIGRLAVSCLRATTSCRTALPRCSPRRMELDPCSPPPPPKPPRSLRSLGVLGSPSATSGPPEDWGHLEFKVTCNCEGTILSERLD